MKVRRVAFADLPASPWRNGAGVTFEVSSVPGVADFDWRLSIARIEHDAPFSTFEGVDRHLVLAADDPLTLAVTGPTASPAVDPAVDPDGDETWFRLERGQVLAFAGEAQVTGHVGPRGATVVNVMTRRTAYRSDVQVVRGDAGTLAGLPDLAAAVDLATLDTVLLCGGHDTEPHDAELLHRVVARAEMIIAITRRPLSHPQDVS